MKINCLLVDDEPIAIDILKSYIKNIEELQVVGECNNALEAYNFLQKTKVDLLLLDIKMPQLSGLEFLKTIDLKPLVILITAYSEHAIEGYEFDVVDYIVKPVSYQRFLKAISKVFNRLELKSNNILMAPQKSGSSFIYLRHDKKMVKVMLNDILYFEGFGNYVKVVTEQREIISYQTLNLLEKQLANDGFVRIHKSFIIPVNKIDAFTNESVEIKKKEIPIGSSYKQAISRIMGKN